MSEQTVIGISFGTVYSCITLPGKPGSVPEVIANEDGDRQIPSYVAFTGYEELCGTQAKLQALANQAGTIHHFKQLLGKKMVDDEVKLNQKRYRVAIVPSTGNAVFPAYETEFFEDGADEPTVVQHTVVQVTAKYFAKLKETAEGFSGKSVDGCVISIPAHFEESQKTDLLKAAHEAGFKSAFALHEPVAAAMAYKNIASGQDKPDNNVLVLDLGAEAFNVTLISEHDGLYTIEESIEEANLGGTNFDKVLLEFAKDDFKKKTRNDISDNKRSLIKLQNACEKAKRALTQQDTVACQVEALYDGMDYNGTILRGRFDMLAEPLYARCKETVLKLLKSCKVTPNEIDQVLLVGGSSRMPRFQSSIKSLFPNVGNGTDFRCDVEPDEAISIGCAIQGGIMVENNVNLDVKFDKALIDANHVGKSIGIKSGDGKFIPIIPSGTPLPVRRSFKVPLAPKQTDVYLSVSENNLESGSVIAEVVLSGLADDIKNGVVEIVFLIENDHHLDVTMTELVSGEKVHALLK
ncbi:heat shock protein 70 family [Globomyces pollinis-pini]|nr:heat shock protein 70 family [Globomyces pollinis-pini]KAJ2999982.1 hypothetical protein HDV02_001239 [Globomyces sp. JEL0801]